MTPPTHQEPRKRRPHLPDKVWLQDIYERVAPIVAIVCLLTAFAAVGWSWQNSRADHRQDQQRIADNDANAVVACQNANQSREASSNLWNFVIDLSLASNPTLTDAQRAFIAEFRDYVGKVYQLHDCGDLSKTYDLPPPPTIPAAPAS